MAESMKGLKRTCRCAEVTKADIGKKVTLMGWVQKSRNKGGIIFVDLRDRSGIMQIIFENGPISEEGFEKAAKLRSEFVIAVEGEVMARSGAVNENLATGELEVKAESLRILSEAETPPFTIEEDSKTREELRLKYRYLDLRRPDIQRNLIMRSKVAMLTREFMSKEGFLEIETPMLTKSTPEGARDYLVPSRVHPGSFYALPQSPQLFKQLLMCSGYDRYIQIVKCFRDEDLRADRQPEFTQIDMELAFVDVDDVIDVNERLLGHLFKEALGVDLQIQHSPIHSETVLVTDPKVNGLKISDLHLSHYDGLNITRLFRAGMELFPYRSIHLQLGDRLRVVGPERAIMRFTAHVGNQSHKLDHPNIISIFVGIALGILAGILPIAIPGIPVPVKLGLAGGPLIVAILLGRYGPNLRLATYTTNSASLMLRELGIAFFLASVGLAAGDGFLQAFASGEGFAYMALGLCITMLPLLVVGYVARRFFSLNYLSIVGMMAGTTTDPPALAYAATLSEKNSSAVAYSTVYPLAMFLRILTGQALLLIFWAEL